MATTLPRRTLPSWGHPGTAEDEQRRRRPPLRVHVPHLVLAATFFAVFTVLTVARYQRMADNSWDLGIFTQVARGWAGGHIPVVPIKGEGFKVLGDHWSPILATLGPLWKVWPSPVMLLVLQAALFAASVGVVSDTAARVLGRTRGLLVGAAYGLSWGLQRALDVEFHEVAFAVPVLAVVGRQLLLKRWGRAAWWCAPLLAVKEDLGLTVAAVGVLLLVNRRWRLGPLLLVAGVAWTAAALWWWIPSFNTGGFGYWDKLSGVGGGPHGAGAIALSLVTRHTVWTTLGWTAGATAFTAWRSPVALLTVPTLAWRFVSDNPDYWGRGWHYSAVVMPVLFLALADAVARAERSSRPWMRTWARNAVTAVVAIAVAVTVSAPLAVADLVDPGTYRGGPHAAALRAAVRTIPDGATVEAATGPLAHLAARCDVYWPGGLKSVPPEFILTEDTRKPQLVADQAGAGHPGRTYRVVFHEESVTVVELVR